jgi:Ca2+-transporting ATPase
VNSPLLDRPSTQFVVGAGVMKAVLALCVLGLVPRLGYDLEVARAAAFHFMAIGQLLLTYPSRHTRIQPLPNPYLHGAVAAGIAIQIGASVLPWTATLLGGATVPWPLWLMIATGALLTLGLAETLARWVWRPATDRRKP